MCQRRISYIKDQANYIKSTIDKLGNKFTDRQKQFLLELKKVHGSLVKIENNGTLSYIDVSGTSDSWYNDSYGPIGVTECTPDYVTVVTRSPLALNPPATGGTVQYSLIVSLANNPSFNSTDCNAKVTVTGGTDRVFISAQLNSFISYEGSGDLTYTVAVNRYKGFINNDPVNPEYRFLFDQTISQKVYNLTGLSGPATLPDIETIFTTIIDEPDPAFYWYILEVAYASDDVGLNVVSNEFDLRSLSAQVVKQ